jgi:hypothetical protein
MEIADGWDGESHVDVVHTEWAAGTQALLVRLLLRDDRVAVDGPDPANWGSRLLLAYSLPDGSTADPFAQPVGFLTGLHSHLCGDYLVASEPHRASDCPFAAGSVLPMAPVEASNSATGERARRHGRGSRSRELRAS